MSAGAAAGGGGSSDILLVALLIGGAFIYTKMARASTTTTPRTVLVPSSASGANGSGAAQIATGITGALSAWLSNMAKGYPDTYNASSATGGLNSFGLTGDIGGSALDPWYG